MGLGEGLGWAETHLASWYMSSSVKCVFWRVFSSPGRHFPRNITDLDISFGFLSSVWCHKYGRVGISTLACVFSFLFVYLAGSLNWSLLGCVEVDA